MTQLMDDNACLEITISVRYRSVPEVHAHTTVLTVGRSHEVGIVETGTVLGVSNDGVVLSTTTTEVVLLEIARHLIETVTIVEIVYHVGGVEELRDAGVDVFLRLFQSISLLSHLRVVGEIELPALASVRTIVVDVRVLAFPVLLSKDVVTPGGCGISPEVLGG